MTGDLFIVHEKWLLVLAIVIGIIVPLGATWVMRRRGRPDETNVAPVLVILGQVAVTCWLWIANGHTITEGDRRHNFLRYEFGWIALVTASVVLGIVLWRKRPAFEHQRIWLAAGLLGIIASQAVSAWVAGFSPQIEVYSLIIAIILVLTVFPMTMTRAVDLTLVALGTVCVVSVAMIVFGVDWAVQGGYRRIPAPFIDGRLRGVVGHPNVLAPLASIGLVLTVTTRRLNMRWLLAPVFALTLWLTDGRTQIAATVAVLAALGLMSFVKRVDRTWFRRSAFAGLAACGLVAILVLGAGSDSSDVQTLNGRTRLWEDALDYWRSSPWIGVGPNAFDVNYRLKPGLGWAGGAHSQIFQSLAGEGIIGVVVLIVTMMIFVSIAVSAPGRRHTQLIATGFIALASMLVETPFWLELYLPQWFLFLSVVIVLFAARPDDHVIQTHGDHRSNPRGKYR